MDRLSEVEGLVRTFLESMSLSLEPTFSEESDCVRVDLRGPDAYLLLERRGSVLDALQLLLGKVAAARCGVEKRIVIDCEGYRRENEQRLVESALKTAEAVRKLGQAVELDPMNPYERRLVHLALQQVPGVTTSSVGEGFLKRVVVQPS